MKNKLPLLISIALICSCSKNDVPVELMSIFPENITLTTSHTIKTTVLVDPTTLVMLDSVMVMSTQNEPHLHAYNLNSGETFHWLNTGRGPNEILNFMHLCKTSDNTISASGAPNKIYTYDIREILKGNQNPQNTYQTAKEPFNNAIITKDDIAIYPSLDRDDKLETYRFCSENLKTNKLSFFGKFPQKDDRLNEIPTGNQNRMLTYQGNLVFNQPKNRAIITYLYAVGFEIIDTQNAEITKSVLYQYPKVISKTFGNIHQIKAIPESKRGFLKTYSTDNYIYFLYSDKTFGEDEAYVGRYILKYNWDGIPETKYTLDYPTRAFTISENEGQIYTISDDDNETIVRQYNI